MGKIDLVDFPAGRILDPFGPVQSNSKESELIAESISSRFFEVSRVIPPLNLEIIVRKKIPGELVIVSWQGLAKGVRIFGPALYRESGNPKNSYGKNPV